jgi:uncharacterized protein YecE (DUF72 family)
MAKPGVIRVGVGGWTYAPWRGAFFPEGLPQKRELEYLSGRLTTIEVNGTYYRTQTPATFAKWRDQTPPGFVFALKAPRYATNRRVLAEAGESIRRFVESGIAELGDKLGPVNWQFLATKRFDADDFARFLDLLPTSVNGRALQHVVELRHDSFRSPELVALTRARGVGIVLAGDAAFPLIEEMTCGIVYARLMGTTEDQPKGYSEAALAAWAKRAKAWARGAGDGVARDVHVYIIGGHKARNPAAALGLLERL